MVVGYNQLILCVEIGSSNSIDEGYRWAKAFGVPAILFKQIECVKEKEDKQALSTLQHRKVVSTSVLKARKILESLEKIKTAIQRKEPIPKYTVVTPGDIANLDRRTEITESEIDSAKKNIEPEFDSTKKILKKMEVHLMDKRQIPNKKSH